MPYLLDLAYLALLLACAPWLAYRSWRDGKTRAGWREKLLGRVPRRIGEAPCVWFHAVSVGEVLLLKPVIAELARRRPDWDVVLSTSTTSGLGVARRTYPELVTFYAPMDFSWASRRAMSRVRPTVLALVETELWPNLIAAAKRFGASVALVNGRLGERSYRGYHRFRGLLGPTLRSLDAVAVQTDEYAGRFVGLGVPRAHVRVTGSIKFDGLEADRDNPKTLALRRELRLQPADLVFVAGSTMEGEEAAALDAYRAARERHPHLRLVLVPRHAERFDKVAELVLARGESLLRRSRGTAVAGDASTPPVVLIDTLGELASAWGLADVAYVGGSLFPGRGGQNMMEPAAYGAALLFGPHTSNFKAAAEGLLAHAAARRVLDPADLAAALLADLDDPESAAARGAAARSFVLAQHGATDRTLAELDRLALNRVEKIHETFSLT